MSPQTDILQKQSSNVYMFDGVFTVVAQSKQAARLAVYEDLDILIPIKELHQRIKYVGIFE